MAFSKRDDRSDLLWTDDYRAAFAQSADAELVTFDKALSKRYRSIRITCLSWKRSHPFDVKSSPHEELTKNQFVQKSRPPLW